MKKFFWILLAASFICLSFCLYFEPISIVAPHHNIVQKKRSEFFKKIRNRRLFTNSIIIIGPDHFSPNQNTIIYGNYLNHFDYKKENRLSKFLSLQNGVVRNDHSILNLLPDLQNVWPKAKIFPILVGQGVKSSYLNNLVGQIKDICGFDCLLIASVDFSHYLPPALANIHDIKSIKELSNQNLIEISKLEVDSPQSLFVLSKFSNLKNAKKFNLFYHSNSSVLENNRDAESTSHIFGFYKKGQSIRKNNFTFIFTSDIDQTLNKQSLGPRFFYGVDDLNPKISFPFEIPNNLFVAGSIFSKKTELIFLPFEKHGEEVNLLRGDKKTEILDKFLSQFQNSSKYFVDKFNGRLNYGQ